MSSEIAIDARETGSVPPSTVGADSSLASFAEALLRFSRETDGSTLHGELLAQFARGLDSTVAQFRRELTVCDGLLSQLNQLAGAKFLPLAAPELRRELESAIAEGVRVARALNRIGLRSVADSVSAEPDRPKRVERIEIPFILADDPVVETPSVAEEIRVEPVPPNARVEEAIASFHQGESLRRAKLYDEAEKCYARAVDLEPTLIHAHVRRAAIQLLRGDQAGAIDGLSTAIRMRPDDPEVYRLRGEALASLERYGEAIADFDEVLKRKENATRVRLSRAVALREKGDWSPALCELERVIREQPQYAVPYFQRGLIYWQRGSVDRARSEFEKALSLYPNYDEAIRALNEIEAAHSGETRTDHPVSRTEGEPLVLPPPSVKRRVADKNTSMIQCPYCREVGVGKSVKGNRVLKCRLCRKHFALRADGTTGPVKLNEDGEWVEPTEPTVARKAWRIKPRWIGLAVWIVGLLFGAFFLFRGESKVETAVELPTDLTQRAELFARAWLKKDTSLMKRLTASTHDKTLFSWNLRHRPPTVDADWETTPGNTVRPSAIVTARKENQATLQVSVEGLPKKTGDGAVRFAQTWEERGGVWFFLPTPK